MIGFRFSQAKHDLISSSSATRSLEAVVIDMAHSPPTDLFSHMNTAMPEGQSHAAHL
jgi:hypothetical protein